MLKRRACLHSFKIAIIMQFYTPHFELQHNESVLRKLHRNGTGSLEPVFAATLMLDKSKSFYYGSKATPGAEALIIKPIKDRLMIKQISPKIIPEMVK